MDTRAIEALQNQDGMKMRALVLHAALNIEQATADILGHMMDLNSKDSRALSYGHGSLNFQQKVMFLIDLDVLKDPQDENLFRTFLEVRNVFAHVIGARTYTDCFEILKDKRNYILRLSYQEKNSFDYPDMNRKNPRDEAIPLEAQLERGVHALVRMVSARTFKTKEVWIKRITKQVEGEVYALGYQTLEKEIPIILASLEQRIKERIATGQSWTNDEVLNIPREIIASLDSAVAGVFPEASKIVHERWKHLKSNSNPAPTDTEQ